MSYSDTIAAISTAPGGAIGIVRVSGREAVDIVSNIFKGIRQLTALTGYTGTLGKIYDGDLPIDEAIVFVYRAPNSYTGEDVCEISLHGGEWVLQRVLELLILNGARQAKAGEFTRRAYVAGKLTLEGAEGVLGLVSATTKSMALGSMRMLAGKTAEKVRAIADKLTDFLAHITATIDYPDEGVEEILETELYDSLKLANSELDELMSAFSKGRLVSSGVSVAIVGKPNVGKSTLLNLLTGEQTAIVSNIAGTTRDVLECSIVIDGHKFILNDTAGLHESEDEIEKIGIARAKDRLAQCNLILAVFDAEKKLLDEDMKLIDLTSQKPTIAILNKCDLQKNIDVGILRENFAKIVEMSAITGDGRLELEKAMLEMSGIASGISPLMCSARQLECATKAKRHIVSAMELMNISESIDIVSIELEKALSALLEIEGKNATEETIERLFENFCVGK